ncbi:MAG: hypothetical protein R3C28_30340 [Pirellulaceae bacterium]
MDSVSSGVALNGKKRESPPTEKLRDGKQEAKIIAMRLGTPPKGYGKWTLRLLARKLVVNADREKVIIVCDNLNTHTKGAFCETY